MAAQSTLQSAELQQAAAEVERIASFEALTPEDVQHLIAAVRQHDAELIRAYRDSLPFDGNAAAAMSLAATHIEPKEQR